MSVAGSVSTYCAPMDLMLKRDSTETVTSDGAVACSP
eukprot:gene7628-9131_t